MAKKDIKTTNIEDAVIVEENIVDKEPIEINHWRAETIDYPGIRVGEYDAPFMINDQTFDNKTHYMVTVETSHVFAIEKRIVNFFFRMFP